VRRMRRALGLAGAVALAASSVTAGEKAAPTYTVRVLWFDMQTRVGTTLRLADVEFTIQEANEQGYPTKASADARATLILRMGFSFEPDPGAGRWQYVPAQRVEQVEVYTVPAAQ
jgi:hypothetical protein